MNSHARETRRRKRLARIALVALSALASLALAEIALRAAGFGRPVRFVSSETLLFRLEPGQSARLPGIGGAAGELRVNSLGLRGRERPREKPPGAFRVVMLGDSVTFGVAVGEDDTIPARLETALALPDGAPSGIGVRDLVHIEVLNAGVPGYSLQQEALYLEEISASLGPDLVTVGFCANDWRLPLDAAETRAAAARDKIAFRSALRRLAIVDVLRWLVDVHGETWLGRDAGSTCCAAPSEADRAILARIEATLAEAGALAARAGARCALLALPERPQLAGAPSSFQEPLRDAAGRAGIAYLDLLPALRDCGEPPEALYAAGGDRLHFSPLGNRVVAEAVAAFLRGGGLVPAGAATAR